MYNGSFNTLTNHSSYVCQIRFKLNRSKENRKNPRIRLAFDRSFMIMPIILCHFGEEKCCFHINSKSSGQQFPWNRVGNRVWPAA